MDQIEIIAEALDRIEERLADNPTVQDIASRSPMSPWHFQRVFRAVVGETVGSYLRRRRLSRSVAALLESDARILDIALDHGFESQEAYTRAFQTLFGLPPGRFRARGRPPSRKSVSRLTSERLRHARALNRQEPSLVELGRARYVGFGQCFISALADDSDNMEVIPELWSRLRARREEITTSVGSEEYGVTCLLPPSERDRSDELLYLAGRRVHGFSPLPSGMEARETLGGLYAVFEHPGTQATIPQTIEHALLSWLPNSGLDFGHGAEIERVEAGGDRVEFWLPVQERSAG